LENSENEIDAYLKQYEDQLTATDSAAKRDEAKENLKNQKMNEAYSTFWAELKEEAKINQFINFN